MFVSWSDDNVQYAIAIIGKSSIVQSKSNLYFYEITGTMSTIACNQISYLSNVLCAPLQIKLNYTPQIRYKTMTDRYYSYATVKDTSQVIDGVTWYEGDVVLTRLNGTTRTELSRTTTSFMSSSASTSYKNEADIEILNDNVFVIETILTAPNKIQATFKQLIGDTLHGQTILTDKDYTRTGLAFTFITNDFNLYRYSYQLDNYLYATDSVFRPTGYNGDPYFSKKSLSPVSSELYDITSRVVFARDLYNKSIVGDTINSIVHVPTNYLNNSPIIREVLKSETNEAIDDANEEIEKNEYEELYINFIDSFKVWDKNDKSTYQQRASYETAKQVNEGFKMYVANFRVTNNDGTTAQSDIGDIPIVDGEGVFEIMFQVPTRWRKDY